MTARPLPASPPENYERFFVPAIGGPMAADLVRFAALAPGERVLDAACGTGVVARLAAEQVGREGSVTGVDINPGMLNVARQAAGEGPFEWHEANVEKLPLPDNTYDAAFCQMSLQFMDDKVRALKEIRRVLADGGRLLVNVPGPVHELFNTLADGMAHHIDPAGAAFVHQVFSLDQEKEMERLLREAGFEAVSVKSYAKELRLPASKDFLWQYVYSTPLAPMANLADESARERLENEVVAGWKPFEADGGMAYEQRVIVAGARK